MASHTHFEGTSRWKRLVSDGVGFGTVGLTLLILIAFLIVPVSSIIIKAFYYQGHFTLEFFSLLFSNELQTEAIKNSVKLGVAATVLATVVAFPLALINARFDFKGKGLWSGLLLVPMIMPPFVGAIGMQRFFARRGSVNLLLTQLGIIDTPIDWLGGDYKFWAVVVIEVLHLYPILYLNLTAALANIDPSLEEMATTLGVPRWRQYKDIIWPLARPGFLAGAIIVFIWALTDLGTPLLVGMHETMPVRIFNMVSDVNQNPVGFAMVFVVIVMTVGFFLLSRLAVGSNKYAMLAKGHVTNPQKPLGVLGTSLVYAFFAMVVAVALLPHFSVIITSFSDSWFMTVLPEHYSTKYYAAIMDNELARVGIKNSLFLAMLATAFDLVLGVLIAYVVVRKLIPFPKLLDALVMVPLALPGIVLAFGYVITFTDTSLDPLHNPIPLLVIAYGIRRLPYMVRSASAGLEQASPSLEEASMTFGASRFYTLRKITMPLVTANLIAGALLCFAYAMLDVSDSLILAMKDRFYPITKAIYALYLEQGSGEFLASSLGVVSMALLTACIIGASLILGKKMGELFKS